ncbi:MAG: oligoendopeptidase F [Lachnospiraceae bacterium]|nr:oligoendopeptidase F [Lachnospiraceae bacterium]
MTDELKSRSEIPEELTWDLSRIYATEEAMLHDMDKISSMCDDIINTYKGNLIDAQTINNCLDAYQELTKLILYCYDYANLAVNVDYYNSHDQELYGKIQSLYATVSSKLSFIDSELSLISEDILNDAMNQSISNKHYIYEILRNKPYLLSPETESTLKALTQTINAPYELYSNIKLADMKFENFNVNGKSYPLGYSMFEDDYEYDKNTDIRRSAFNAFSKKIKEYEHATATAYQTHVQTEKTLATLRGYESVIDYLLYSQEVDKDMYHRQIDLITSKLAPHMRKYAKLLKRIHKLDKMTFADLKISVDPDYDPSVTIEESKHYIENGLSILGDDYINIVKRAYNERWIDFAKNKGKCTGGFCSSPYQKGSYILLTWNNRMADVFTLAHELGHAGHFYICNQHQSVLDSDVSTYFVEAPSTMNELIMANYLKNSNPDKRFRRWVLSSMISNTFYHNFVTHLIEAAYQREVYKIIDNGGSVNAEVLSKIMKETLQNFWGDAVEINEGAELTWMRQPHYYMGLYSYTYSAGLTVATQVAKRIESEGSAAINDWMKVLATGGTKTPLELAQMAGVDISTDKPLLDTIDYIGQMIDEICSLTDELENENL